MRRPDDAWRCLQEFEKLAGRPYVVCYFNADAPMTALPDTVQSLPVLTIHFLPLRLPATCQQPSLRQHQSIDNPDRLIG